MSELLKLLDPYELRARVAAGLLMMVPVLLLLLAVFPPLRSGAMLGAVGLVSLLAATQVGQWMRDRAQPQQAALFRSWGGAPTTQILRWRDPTISDQEKNRARDALLRLGTLRWPDCREETQNPDGADADYQNITGAILDDARSEVDSYRRLDRANGNYGFLRNCFYSRGLGTIVVGLAMLITTPLPFVHALSTGWRVPLMAALGYLALEIYWVFSVTERRLRASADAFAIEVFRHIHAFAKRQAKGNE